MVESINFVCLGQTELVKELGKKGQSSDITIYDNKKDDRIITYVIPSGYPDNRQDPTINYCGKFGRVFYS
jgi:selenocysteine-specific translation elongation factor